LKINHLATLVGRRPSGKELLLIPQHWTVDGQFISTYTEGQRSKVNGGPKVDA
jgi:hypothetical protein